MAIYTRGLRAHVRKLADKRYFEQLNSPEFVVLYLPGEQYLGAALEVDGTLLDEAFRQRVIIATPTTLIALLWSVACGWQQAKVAEEARAIAELGRELYNRIGVLLTHVDLVSKRLNSLVLAQNKVTGSLQTRVLPAARRFPTLGVVDASSALDVTRSANLHASRIEAPEFQASDNGGGDENVTDIVENPPVIDIEVPGHPGEEAA
jgi:DNA recombination protein RmuC